MGAREQPPPEEVTRDLFLAWRKPRLGTANPTDLTNPVWTWLARNPDLSAYHANAHFEGPSSVQVGPCWCGSRFGQSRTTLADGRVVAIGGEHEDYYDPDFFIYNDVIVEHSSGELVIYGYPHQAFAPTDFHSATLVGEQIVIVGGLGYRGSRAFGTTPVYALDTTTFAMAQRATTGTPPGWIHKHTAELAPDGRTIAVRGGLVVATVDGEERTSENIDEWELDLEASHWTRLTERQWQQWGLLHADGRHNQLFELERACFHARGTSVSDREQLAKLVNVLGEMPDLALYDARFSPPAVHTPVPNDDVLPEEVRIVVDGVTVRYVWDWFEVWISFEGLLPQEQIDAIVEDARCKLEALEKAPYTRRRLR